MVNIKSLPKHLRPREKLIEKGVVNLTNKELLAILLRTGREGRSALDVANDILNAFPVDKLLGMTYQDMVKLKGINSGKACTLLAAFELGKRAIENYDSNLPIIRNPHDALNQLTDIQNLKKEYFVVLYLNARKQLIHKETVSIGTLTASLVHPREVFEPAIRHSASELILAHNHPSGNCEPSSDDIRITETLVKSGQILGIQVCDHLIVTKGSFVSLREKGLI